MIKLELMKREDLEKVLSWNKDKDEDYLLQWAGPLYSYPLTLLQLKDSLKAANKEVSESYIYKIISKESNEIVGTIELKVIGEKIGRVCRFLIDEQYRGGGRGTEAIEEVLSIGFEKLGFDKITLGVFDFNEGAIKCYEKVGFVKDEFKENARKSSKGYWNLYNMGISKTKWLERTSK